MQKLDGNCSYCDEKIKDHGKSIKSHLKKCSGLTEQRKQLKSSTYLILKVESNYTSHWLTLKVHPNVMLYELDSFLREVWLECCGHMCEFSLGRAFSGQTLNMEASVGAALSIDGAMGYVYDFGSSTELTIKKIDECEMPNDGNLVLLIQNEAPEIPCTKCKKKAATEICLDCLYDGEQSLYCSTCINKHGHLPDNSDYDEAMPFVNSPRAGVCAYEGPVDFSGYMPSKKEIKPKAKNKKEATDLIVSGEDSFFEDAFSMFGMEEEDAYGTMNPAELAKMMKDPMITEMMQKLQEETGLEISQSILPLTYSLLLHYKFTADKAMAKLSEEDFFYSPNKHTHSIAAIVRHISIHLRSNWSDILTTDANKFREGDAEFSVQNKTKEEILIEWESSWKVLYSTLESFETIKDILQKMQVGGHAMPIWLRLHISTPHYAYHIGQIVQMTKLRSNRWDENIFELGLPNPEEHKQPKAKEISINRKKKKP